MSLLERIKTCIDKVDESLFLKSFFESDFCDKYSVSFLENIYRDCFFYHQRMKFGLMCRQVQSQEENLFFF